MLDIFTNPYPSTDMTYLNVYRAIASPVGPGLAAKPKRSPICAGFWASMKTDDDGFPETSAASSRPPRYTTQDLRGVLDPLHQMGACQQADQPHLTGRVLFSLAEGLLGLGPRRTAVDDAVYVVSGAPVPFVLRGRADGTALTRS
jgi:hypothetical protein